jgi:hypothetical protein
MLTNVIVFWVSVLFIAFYVIYRRRIIAAMRRCRREEIMDAQSDKVNSTHGDNQ